MSDSIYTNDEISVQWLKHFILHTKSSLNACKKVLILWRDKMGVPSQCTIVRTVGRSA
jgi:hypothetical protein